MIVLTLRYMGAEHERGTCRNALIKILYDYKVRLTRGLAGWQRVAAEGKHYYINKISHKN